MYAHRLHEVPTSRHLIDKLCSLIAVCSFRALRFIHGSETSSFQHLMSKFIMETRHEAISPVVRAHRAGFCLTCHLIGLSFDCLQEDLIQTLHVTLQFQRILSQLDERWTAVPLPKGKRDSQFVAEWNLIGQLKDIHHPTNNLVALIEKQVTITQCFILPQRVCCA
jgi:hypothetical protein